MQLTAYIQSSKTTGGFDLYIITPLVAWRDGSVSSRRVLGGLSSQTVRSGGMERCSGAALLLLVIGRLLRIERPVSRVHLSAVSYCRTAAGVHGPLGIQCRGAF